MTTLSDAQILERVHGSGLITHFDLARLGAASYELRMGDIYYDLTESDARIDASSLGSILIKPGHRVVLITKEQLEIPYDLLARIVSKGSLFSIGLSPVSTYADPGFVGQLGIVTQNMSDRYIQLSLDEPIAKIEFSLLSSVTSRPYRGQHGFHTQIWPIKHQLQRSHAQVATDPRVQSEIREANKIIPAATVAVIRKIQARQQFLDALLIGLILLNSIMLLLVSTDRIEFATAILTNILSSVLVGVISYLARSGVGNGTK